MNGLSNNSPDSDRGLGHRSLANAKQHLKEKYRDPSAIPLQITTFEDLRGVMPINDGILQRVARFVIEYLDELTWESKSLPRFGNFITPCHFKSKVAHNVWIRFPDIARSIPGQLTDQSTFPRALESGITAANRKEVARLARDYETPIPSGHTSPDQGCASNDL